MSCLLEMWFDLTRSRKFIDERRSCLNVVVILLIMSKGMLIFYFWLSENWLTSCLITWCNLSTQISLDL
jgi:hypothetical protein